MSRKFYEDALNDGWEQEQTYPGSTTQADWFTLRKDGWVMHADAVDSDSPRYTVWGPDRLQINVPVEYSMDKLTDALRTCLECGGTNVDTSRVGFAGRACDDCLPGAKEKYEFPGWTN